MLSNHTNRCVQFGSSTQRTVSFFTKLDNFFFCETCQRSKENISTSLPSSASFQKIIPDLCFCTQICDSVLACHETFKRGLFFLKAFCIHLRDRRIPLPTPDHSLTIACLEQVCEKIQTGVKSEVIELTRDNSEKVFSDIYHFKVDVRGKSKLKRLVAEQMLTVVSTNVSVRFENRCTKLYRSVGDLSKKSACRVVRSAFSGNWEDVPVSCELLLSRESCQIIPCAGHCKKRSKRFADRDLNAAANTLLIGTCKERSLVFARSRKRKGSEEESVSHKKTKLSVDAERTLSDSVPLTSEDVNGDTTGNKINMCS